MIFIDAELEELSNPEGKRREVRQHPSRQRRAGEVSRHQRHQPLRDLQGRLPRSDGFGAGSVHGTSLSNVAETSVPGSLDEAQAAQRKSPHHSAARAVRDPVRRRAETKRPPHHGGTTCAITAGRSPRTWSRLRTSTGFGRGNDLQAGLRAVSGVQPEPEFPAHRVTRGADGDRGQ